MKTWRSQAACRGKPTSWFFALPRTPEAELAAQICAECPVAEPCAAAGRANRELGRWGSYVRLVERYRTSGRERDFICWGCGDAFLTKAGLKSHQVQKPCRRGLERDVVAFERDIDGLEAEVRSAV